MAKKQVTDAQKKAMAKGRADSRIVKEYLEAVDRNRPRRGRKRTPQSIRKKLAEIDSALESADQLQRVNLVQQRMDLQLELESLDKTEDIAGLETAFVGIAKDYSHRRGITWAAWREVGVPVSTLKAAGISRSS